MQRFLSIGVMAHVDAGKTTFSEQLLYHTGSIRTRGRVDHQDAFLDNDRLERERGITIFSNHAPFSIGEHQYWLLDTPGHADFGAEMERPIQAMDYAIVLVSCVEGIQAHTEQVWKLLKRYGVPVFFFLNKTDRTGARPDEVLHQLQKRMSSAVCDCSGCFGEGAQLSEELIEQIAAEDEELMEMYLDGGYEEERWLNKMAQLVAKRELFPCFRGSALQDEGIEFIFNADVGSTVSAEELKARYDAVVLCCGAKQARDIQAPGRDAQGIFFAVDYLTSVTRSLLDSGFADGRAVSAAGKRVLVIGGGDTGNDCVGTAIRQGCESVTQLEMMPCPPAARAPGNDWPEWPRVLKTDYGQQEAIALFGNDPRVYQTTVKEFYKNESGQVCGALIAKLKSEVVDGRRQMVPTGEEYTVDCDLVLIAAGFTGCEPYVADAFGVELTARGTVADVKYATADPKVFACGDMRRGQSLVVWALREGRDTAAVVDEKLMGYTNL